MPSNVGTAFLRGILRDISFFNECLKRSSVWNFAEPYAAHGVEAAAEAIDDEIRRSELASAHIGRRIFKAAKAFRTLKGEEVNREHLANFVVHGTGYGVESEIEDFAREVTLALAERDEASDEDVQLDSPEMVMTYCRGVSDIYAASRVVQWLDRLPSISRHLLSRGKLKSSHQEFVKWARGTGSLKKESADRLAPVRALVETRELVLVPASIIALRAQRDHLLSVNGFSTGPIQQLQPSGVQPGEDESASRGPFLPATDIKCKYGIPPTRLRVARHRGRLSAIQVFGTPHYSLPDCMKLWPGDFHDL